MNRITKKFQDLKKKKKKAFIAFITAGFPNLRITKQLVLAFEQRGVDIVELGVPFSDPLADGPTIQAASQAALKKDITLPKIFKVVQKIRRYSQIPIALMTYYNPVFAYGEKRFIAHCVRYGVDGIIIPDFPPEEATVLINEAKKQNVATVFFLSPTTMPSRIPTILRATTGFLYYVSLTGVTGARTRLPRNIAQNVSAIKRRTNKPVCVGFGISTSKQVKEIAKVADGVIIGSAVIKAINSHLKDKKLVEKVSGFVGKLSRPLK